MAEQEQRRMGRPTDAVKDVRVFARVTEAERDQYKALGGSEWLRRMLAEAREPKGRGRKHAR